MAANFASANTQLLRNTGAPAAMYSKTTNKTIGMWFNFTTTSLTPIIYSIQDPPGTGAYCASFLSSAVLNLEDGWATVGNLPVVAVSAGQWYFYIARHLGVSNRRAALLNSVTGIVTQVSDTTTLTQGATALTDFNLGTDTASANDYLNGAIAEFWYMNADPQGSGADFDEAMIRQLAYGGPFSVPHVAQAIIEYRSFRKVPTYDEFGEVYNGQAGPQTWVNNNAVSIGPHPPLPYWYVRPDQALRPLVI